MNITALEASRQTGAPIFDQLDLDTGVPAAVMRQEAREQSLDRLWGGAQAHNPCLSAFERARPFPERVHIGHQSPGAPQQILALGCELKPASDTVEELHVQLRLERANLPRQRRLTATEPGDRAADPARVSHADERMEVV